MFSVIRRIVLGTTFTLLHSLGVQAEPFSAVCHEVGLATEQAAALRVGGMNSAAVTARLSETHSQAVAGVASGFAFRYRKLNSYAIYDFFGKYCMLIDPETSSIPDADWQLLMQFLYSAEHCVYTGAASKDSYGSCMREINPSSRQELEDKRGLVPPQ